eukprot:356682-Chlamydomonas_euryale.AAC.1
MLSAKHVGGALARDHLHGARGADHAFQLRKVPPAKHYRRRRMAAATHLEQVEQLGVKVWVLGQRVEEHVADAAHAVAVVEVRAFCVQQHAAVAVEEARARRRHVGWRRVLTDRRKLGALRCQEVAHPASDRSSGRASQQGGDRAIERTGQRAGERANERRGWRAGRRGKQAREWAGRRAGEQASGMAGGLADGAASERTGMRAS